MLPGRKYTPDFLLDLLRRRWWLIALPCALGLFVALLVSRTIPSLYLSETLIQIVPQRVPDDYVRPTVTMSLDDRLKSIQQQILSRTRLEQTIQEFDLYPDVRRRSTMEDAVEKMRETIVVQLVGGNGGVSRARAPQDVDAFRVQFTYTDPLVTMKVTERLASWFIDENSRLRGAQAEATNEFLEAQLKEAKANLEAQERRVKEFSERHSGSLPSQMQSNMQAIQSLQLQLQALIEQTARDRDRKLMLERLHADAVTEDAQLSSAPPPAPPATAAPGTLPGTTAKQQLEAARQALAQALLRLTQEHPDVIRLKHQVAELEQKASAEAKLAGTGAAAPVTATPTELARKERIRQQAAEIESLGRQIAFKEQQVDNLQGQIGQYRARIDAVPGIESEYTSISRDYATSQESYKNLLTKSQESKVAANLERYQIGEQFRTLDPPRVPTAPVSPQRLIFTVGGLIGGLVLGVLLVGVLEVLDSSFRSEADVVNAVNLPVLAVVPAVATKADIRRANRQHRTLLTTAAGGAVMAAGLAWYLELWRYIA